jgi:hypothetical protein
VQLSCRKMVREVNTRRYHTRFPYVDEKSRTIVVPWDRTLSTYYGVELRMWLR